jgi:hypothetical protein
MVRVDTANAVAVVVVELRCACAFGGKVACVRVGVPLRDACCMACWVSSVRYRSLLVAVVVLMLVVVELVLVSVVRLGWRWMGVHENEVG